MEKLIITAAISGAEVTKEHNPNIPYTVEEIGNEAKRAYEAGASIIHLHVREDDGMPTQRVERFKECMDVIRLKCKDVIIQPSTGGATGMSNDERLQPLMLYPEMATLDCGTLNFGGDVIFTNSENTILEFAKKMKENNVKPELEVFDRSMINTALRLYKKGFFENALHFNLVMGIQGGIGATLQEFAFLVNSISDDFTYTATGVGRHQFPIASLAIVDGGHVRVGFEDNIYIEHGIKASSNGELVEKAVRLSNELGRSIATPSEARKILGLKEL